MFFPRLGLWGNLIFYGVAGILVVLAVLFRVTTTAVEESTEALLKERIMLARSIAEEIEVPLQHALHTMQQIASSSSVAPDNPQTYQNMLDALYTHFTDFHHFNVMAMAALDPRGTVLYTKGERQRLESDGSLSHPAVLQMLATRSAFLTTSADQSSAMLPSALLGAPIVSGEGQLLGALLAAVDPVHPSLSLARVGQLAPERYQVEIADKRGRVIAASRLATVGQVSEHVEILLPRALQESSGAAIHDEPREEEEAGERDHVIAYAQLPTLGWLLIVEQDQDIALALPAHLRDNFLLLGALAVLTIVGLGGIIAHQLLTPIGMLTTASQKIAAGDLEVVVPVQREDEVGRLARSFEQMRVGLKASRDEIRRWNRELEDRVEQRTKELAALFEAARAITSVLDQGALIEVFMAQVRAIVPQADVAILFLLDPSSNSLVAKGGFGLDTALLPAIPHPWERTLAGHVFQGQHAMKWAEAGEVLALDEGFLHEVASRLGSVCCAVGVPLATQERGLGSVVIYTLTEQACPSDHDLQVLQTLADQMAVALENARLFEEAKLVGTLQRLNALKSEFVAWASHELRTPLAAIKSLAETLLREDLALSSADQTEFLTSINASCDRLARVLDNLLTLSKIEAGQLEMKSSPLSLRPLLHQVVEQFRFQDPDHRFVVSVSPGLPPIWADPDRVEDVLSNLLSNAAKYSPQGSAIRVTAQPEAWQRDGQGQGARPSLVVISVTDRGVGIPQEALGRLFQRFSRIDAPDGRRIAGSGLGLYISKTYAEAMGGTIWVESQEGTGSTFSFALPVAEGVVPPGTASPPRKGRAKVRLPSHAERARLAGRYVLLVDDEPEVLRALETDLHASGARTRTSQSGEECLALVQEEQPDAIILDMVLPGISGLEVLRHLQAHPETRTVPVIMLSARAQEQDMVAAGAEGARAYLKKPFSILQLRTLLADLLRRAP